MTDPYIPTLASFSWSTDESAAIDFALTQGNPWDETCAELKHVKMALLSAKKKIRDFHLQRQSNTCCYCRTNLYQGGSFMVDREHIVPKGKFKPLAYTIGNLSVCCKRCNMEFKGEDVDFLLDKDNIEANHANGSQYYFIHPNYDCWDSYLERKSGQVNTAIIVKYKFIERHPKAIYTYDFFKLQQLEVDSFDEAQRRPGLTEKQKDTLRRLKELLEED